MTFGHAVADILLLVTALGLLAACIVLTLENISLRKALRGPPSPPACPHNMPWDDCPECCH